MSSGKIGDLSWKTGEDGSLILEGSGTVSIDTERGPGEGMLQVEDHPESHLSFCNGCRHWLSVVDGEMVHDDIQSVECVLRS